ncbi:MAG: 1-deoxy-D-xylulose-5-phosphate synthase, partial [FCB group bacterium]
MRKAFSETLVKLAEKDPKLVFITGDMGYNVFNEFENKFPDRFVNVGVAEAEMINVAAGLAAEGFKPITYSITSFATGRPFEQIRYCLAYPEMPVMMVGAGRGFLYSNAGVSHHAIDDVGIMRIIPGITITTPADP